jgi:hypothetical protein
VPFMGEDGTPMYYGKAAWTDTRHVPDYDAVGSSYDVKHKGCMRDKFLDYEFSRAGMCVGEHDDESDDEDDKPPPPPTAWYTYDVSDCANGMLMRSMMLIRLSFTF